MLVSKLPFRWKSINPDKLKIGSTNNSRHFCTILPVWERGCWLKSRFRLPIGFNYECVLLKEGEVFLGDRKGQTITNHKTLPFTKFKRQIRHFKIAKPMKAIAKLHKLQKIIRKLLNICIFLVLQCMIIILITYNIIHCNIHKNISFLYHLVRHFKEEGLVVY